MADNTFTVTDVRNAFKPGATPDETDYARLIDLAAVASKATGAEAGDATTLHPGAGLTVGADGKLAVLEGKGIAVVDGSVAVRVDDSTVRLDDKTQQLGIVLKPDAGLSKDGGLHIVTGAGLTTDADGLNIALAKNSGLTKAKKKLSIQVDPKASGLEFGDAKGLKVRLNTKNNYIVSGTEGVTFNDDGISKIKAALAQISLNELKAAVTGTDSGFKKETGAASGSVESQIGAALNTAYAAGWDLEKARVALGTFIKAFIRDKANEKKFRADSVISLSYRGGYRDLYAKDAKDTDDEAHKFTEKTLKAARINEDGGVSWVTLSGNLENATKGMYAIIGIIDTDGKPAEKGGYYTEHALMVVVSGTSFAIVGYWQLLSDGSWNRGPEFDPLVYNEGHQACITELEDSKPVTVPGSVWTDKDSVINLTREARVALKNTGDVLYFVPGSSPEVWKKVVKEDGPGSDGKVTIVGEGALEVLAVEVPATDGKHAGVAGFKMAVHIYPYQIADTLNVKIPKDGLDLFKAGILKGNYDASKVSFTLVDPTDKTLNAKVAKGKTLTCEGMVRGKVTIEVEVKEADGIPKLKKACTLYVEPEFVPTWGGKPIKYEWDSKGVKLTLFFPAQSGLPMTLINHRRYVLSGKSTPWETPCGELKACLTLKNFTYTDSSIIDGRASNPRRSIKTAVQVNFDEDGYDEIIISPENPNDVGENSAAIDLQVGLTAKSDELFYIPGIGDVTAEVKFI